MTKTLGRITLRTFGMTDTVWARHANPLSVWTRFTVLPMFVLAVWSRVWFGWPTALALTGLTVFWAWINPRLFPPPASLDNWASKAVLGERIWLNRDDEPIPQHHARMASILSVTAACGVPFLLWGLYALDIWPTLLGISIIYLGKLWFIDRMVWLYEDTSRSRKSA